MAVTKLTIVTANDSDFLKNCDGPQQSQIYKIVTAYNSHNVVFVVMVKKGSYD